jgi:uncharacterized integral membrane protein
MLFRLLLLLAVVGALTVFALQNLTPLLPLVFLGIQFPPLPLAWWVLGAIAAGALSMLIIQVLIGLSNFAAGQSARARIRTASDRQARAATSSPEPEPERRRPRESRRRDRSAASDDSTWQDWRGYESTSTQTPPRPTQPVDDWERPPSDDWEHSTPQDSPRDRAKERFTSDDLKNFETTASPKSETRSGSTYSYSYREPQDTDAGKPESVVDADFRVIVPPYRPLDDATISIPPPPPPPVEENADDWFEDTPDDFGEPKSDRKP